MSDTNLKAHDASLTGPRHGIPSYRLRYTPLERLAVERPVDRIATIVAACAGKSVLDLGAMDETAYKSKRGQGVWLHEEIAKRAKFVVGVDNTSGLPVEGLATAPNAKIERGDIFDLDGVLRKLDFTPEVVVAGELVEHLENPLAFLRSLRACAPLKGARLILSTPNATALHNCLIGLIDRESTHHDHLLILSYKTMTTLLTRAGFEQWRLVHYHSEFAEMKLRNSGLRRTAIVCGERMIRAAEWAFPLLAFGLIVDTTI
ncbi:class I SAM-dependent methyltransferase [Methylocystis parvus]|uniref:Class I SAM-dependent methyltransferase n=1 Tax=Methylocystis parvus TaxID=134 RepID=A0A6B8M5G8_9HYPH|nr:methyltransferase domain-containing protein [Methylocystis parvus]QGM96070.1 class I SAM-dependent methyltransferase [Methylocystis parvus]WBK00113.1 class I SAM-dependent methyltransferase [Methylocystis parvus OBBP]